jgi:ATP-binding cassette subfamily C protein LapB
MEFSKMKDDSAATKNGEAAPASKDGAATAVRSGGLKEPRLDRRRPAPLVPSQVDYMPGLLRSLATLIRLKGKAVSPQFLMAGLAGSSVSAESCLRAAARCGFQGRVMHRPTLAAISDLTLPCILLLRGDHVCTLIQLDEKSAKIILPENGEDVTVLDRQELEERYSGFTVFGTMENRVDSRVESLTLTRKKHWFWDVIFHFSPIYRHVAAASLIVNLIAVVSPLFVMNVYDRVVPNNALETLWVLALGICVAYLFDFLLKNLRTRFVDLAGRNADVVLSGMLLDKVLTMRLEAKPESTGALVNNLREFESLREFFSSSSLLALIDLPFLFLFLTILWFIGGPLVFLPIAAMPFMLGGGLLLHLRARRAAEHGYKHNMQKNALLTEIVGGLETVKSNMAESRMQRLWEEVVNISAESSAEAHEQHSRAVSFASLVTQIVTVAMVVWGVYRIGDGQLTMGGLIGCNILLGRTMAPLLQLAALLTRLQNSLVSLAALNAVMALPSENQEEQGGMDFGPLRPAFSLEDVSFAYPGAERLALDRVSLRIGAGERVGVIGAMGSGKSTLGKLLLGLYRPTQGAVKLDGVDIRQIPGADLRGRIGAMPQDVVLFYGSIRDNISLGDPTLTDHVILRAATLSGAIDFIRANPAGFGAQVGEQGRNLSGGQRQAVALARALVHDPEVLLLDEPTGNMDIASESRAQQRLMTIMRGRTLILITHRLSMLKMVDRLVVLEDGRILHDGPRDAVLKTMRAGTGRDPRARGVQTAPVPGKTVAVARTGTSAGHE